ncbi:F-box protein [Raphanus sativus]|nr:F-box protein [Raphanus sativus]
MNLEDDELCYHQIIQVEINDELWTLSLVTVEIFATWMMRFRCLSKYFRIGIKIILRRSSSAGSSSSSKQQASSCSSEIRRFNLQTFLSSGDLVVGLSVRASKIKLTSYRGRLHETHFALYKLPTLWRRMRRICWFVGWDFRLEIMEKKNMILSVVTQEKVVLQKGYGFRYPGHLSEALTYNLCKCPLLCSNLHCFICSLQVNNLFFTEFVLMKHIEM